MMFIDFYFVITTFVGLTPDSSSDPWVRAYTCWVMLHYKNCWLRSLWQEKVMRVYSNSWVT